MLITREITQQGSPILSIKIRSMRMDYQYEIYSDFYNPQWFNFVEPQGNTLLWYSNIFYPLPLPSSLQNIFVFYGRPSQTKHLVALKKTCPRDHYEWNLSLTCLCPRLVLPQFLVTKAFLIYIDTRCFILHWDREINLSK